MSWHVWGQVITYKSHFPHNPKTLPKTVDGIDSPRKKPELAPVDQLLICPFASQEEQVYKFSKLGAQAYSVIHRNKLFAVNPWK